MPLRTAVARFFEGVPLRPITPFRGAVSLAHALMLVTVLDSILPAYPTKGIDMQVMFLGFIVTNLLNAFGANLIRHPSRTLVLMVVTTIAIVTIDNTIVALLTL